MPMSRDAPTAAQAAALVWRDARRVLTAMPTLAAVAVAIVVALGLIETLLAPGHEVGSLVASFLSSMAEALVLTPYLIAVHRFIILGEVTARYALTVGDRRFQRFFGWSVVLALISFAPIFLALLLPLSPGSRVWFMLIFGFIIVVVALRVTILFPAVAVDAPSASWRNAMADTAGFAWRIFMTGIISVFPWFLVSAVVTYVCELAKPGITAAKVVGTVANGVLAAVMAALLVVVASRFYQWLGDRVRRPASA
jgi:hypothetical protein